MERIFFFHWKKKEFFQVLQQLANSLFSEYLNKWKLFGAWLHDQDDDLIGSGRDLTMTVMFFQWLSLRWY